MTTKEAIRHLQTCSSTNGSGQTTDRQHEEAKKMAIEALDRTCWIPCKERLPEEEIDVLVSVKEVGGNYIDIMSLRNYLDGKIYWFNWVCHKVDFKSVVAWMPLPEVYKGE